MENAYEKRPQRKNVEHILQQLEKHDIYINLDLLEPAHMYKPSLTAQFMMRHLYGS